MKQLWMERRTKRICVIHGVRPPKYSPEFTMRAVFQDEGMVRAYTFHRDTRDKRFVKIKEEKADDRSN